MKYFTQKEFINKVKISKPTVQNYTKELEKQGYQFERDSKGHRRYTMKEVDLFNKIFNYLDEANGRISLEQVVRSLFPKPEERYLPFEDTEIYQQSYLELACDLADTDEYVPPTDAPIIVSQEQLLLDFEFVAEMQFELQDMKGRISDAEENHRRLQATVDRQAKASAKRSLQTSKIARDMYEHKQKIQKLENALRDAKMPWWARQLKKFIDLFRKKATQ